MNTAKGTDMTSTYKIRVKNSWWDNFLGETIAEEAEGVRRGGTSTDPLIVATAELIEHIETKGNRTKKSIGVELDARLMTVLYSQAQWFAYYWGEAMVQDAYDNGERISYASKGRSSKALVAKLVEAWPEVSDFDGEEL